MDFDKIIIDKLDNEQIRNLYKDMICSAPDAFFETLVKQEHLAALNQDQINDIYRDMLESDFIPPPFLVRANELMAQNPCSCGNENETAAEDVKEVC